MNDHLGSSSSTPESLSKTARTYPYEAWVLTPSFKPKKVVITHLYKSYSSPNAWDVAEGGKLYSVGSELFATKEEAIEAGWARVLDQEMKLSKQQAAIYKRREALVKAAAA
jgi:hypothetical protein